MIDLAKLTTVFTQLRHRKLNSRNKIQEKYITALVSQLKDRLPEVEELVIFDPSKLPEESAEESFAAYGRDKIEHLSSCYGEGDKADICKMYMYVLNG